VTSSDVFKRFDDEKQLFFKWEYNLA
jgi:hypothetical protein